MNDPFALLSGQYVSNHHDECQFDIYFDHKIGSIKLKLPNKLQHFSALEAKTLVAAYPDSV